MWTQGEEGEGDDEDSEEEEDSEEGEETSKEEETKEAKIETNRDSSASIVEERDTKPPLARARRSLEETSETTRTEADPGRRLR